MYMHHSANLLSMHCICACIITLPCYVCICISKCIIRLHSYYGYIRHPNDIVTILCIDH